MTQMKKLFSMAGILTMALSMSACDMSTPSHLQVNKMVLREKAVAKSLEADHVDMAGVAVIAHDYTNRGKGAMVLNVPYEAHSDAAKKMAQGYGSSYQKAFIKSGVSDVSMVMVPVTDKNDAQKIVITYEALAALPADGCRRLPGHDGPDNMDAVDGYAFGCEMQLQMSKMIANPADLAGRAGVQDNDSRRSGPFTEPYKSGVPNKKIQGYSASGIGG